MSKLEFKNAKDFEKEYDRIRHEIWDTNYQQRQVIESLGYKIMFRLLFGLYYMVNNLEYENATDKFDYSTFLKFMDRDHDAPYEKFMGKVSGTDGISLFIKACIATEGQEGYAPIAYKLLVEYKYRDTIEAFSNTNIIRANKFGFIEGILELSKDFLGVTSPDIAKMHMAMSPIYSHEYSTHEAFVEAYNNVGV